MINKLSIMAGALIAVIGLSLSACHSGSGDPQPATAGQTSNKKPIDTEEVNKLEKPPVDLNSVADDQRVPSTDKVPEELRPPKS